MTAFTQSTAKIAAWNLAGYGGICDKRLERQAEGLALLDAEVVALVEINPKEVSPKKALGTLTNSLAERGVVYESIFLPQENALQIGVLFKKGVKATNECLLAKSDLGKTSNRKAFVVDMKVGRFDFKLIVVHLKSGRGAQAQKTRDRQCHIIGNYISKLRKPGKHHPEDVLLVGDFNMIPGQDVSNFHHLGGNGLMNFISSWDLQESFSHILKSGRANLLDGFAISRKYSTEYVRGSLRLFPMHWAMDMGREKFRKTVSDHLPFVATVRIDRSRD